MIVSITAYDSNHFLTHHTVQWRWFVYLLPALSRIMHKLQGWWITWNSAEGWTEGRGFNIARSFSVALISQEVLHSFILIVSDNTQRSQITHEVCWVTIHPKNMMHLFCPRVVCSCYFSNTGNKTTASSIVTELYKLNRTRFASGIKLY